MPGRGQGRGRGIGRPGPREAGRGAGMGAAGACICPSCGRRQAHQPGLPCIDERCPNCGTALVREGSPHHMEIERRRASRDEES
jgi:hypothetical protein